MKDVKKDRSLLPNAFEIATVFRAFEDIRELLLRASWPLPHCVGTPQGKCQHPFFFTHAVIALITCISNHPWLVSTVHKILVFYDLFLVV